MKGYEARGADAVTITAQSCTKTKMLRQARKILLQVFQLCQYRQIMAAASASVADE